MGSLEDEMKGLKEDHQLHEKTDDGQSPSGSESNDLPEAPQINMCQESTAQGDHQPKVHIHASYTEEGGKNQLSKCQVLSGEDINNLNSIQDFSRTDTVPPTQQPEADKTTATHNNTTVSNEFLNDGEGAAEEEEKITVQCREKEAEVESVSVPVPSTPDPRSPDPRSPAPYGQHHMRTQVSLEVVQCRSAATSPMTPPEGGHSFFFPSSFGGSAAVGTDTKDVELQVGRQVEFCSVATSPMTPKTPSTTAFPELIGREMVQKNGQVKSHVQQRVSGQQESFPVTRGLAEAELEISGVLKVTTSKGLNEGTAAVLMESEVTLEGMNQQCKQQRMGSMDQDITILVTHYGINEEGEEEKTESFFPIEPEMVKIEEYEEVGENESDGKRGDGKEKISRDSAAPGQAQETNSPQNKSAESSVPASKLPVIDIKSDSSEGREYKDGCAVTDDVFVTKCRVPESPAPSGCHNMRTQVSLEVVQCQSAATSPMTPPDGDHAFSFPSSFGKCAAVGAETKDAELQVGQQVEFRSVATAPMTPRTPTTTTFPELRKEANIKEKMAEVKDAVDVPEEEKEKVEEAKEDETDAINHKEKGEEKCEEPVQEVSWDEKGMTWEVYGAVVEVAVLGSAIQKHLEKQVKKQKKPSMPPPPPLNPSAMPLTPEPTQGASGSGKGRAGKRRERDGKVNRRRRNPFRLLMENMQQPHCCSRAHTSE